MAKSRILNLLWDDIQPDPAWLSAVQSLLKDDRLDPDFRALCMALPSEDDLAQACSDAGRVPDPTAISAARKAVARALAAHLETDLRSLIETMATPGTYDPRAADAGKRALKNAALRLLTHVDSGPARAAYEASDNMTDQIAAFAALLGAEDTDIAEQFEAQWSHDRLVMDKWFMLQVAEAAPENAVATARRLTQHPAFDPGNPNRFRSVIGGLTSANPAGFHDASGAGYAFVADWLLYLDAKNPQTAARMSTAFESWRRYDADRQQLMQVEMRRMRAAPGLSRDLTEMLERMLAA